MIRRQNGFTIAELMIATFVFSTILLVVTIGVMRFSHEYYAGATQSSTQDTARSIMDEVTQAIQFSGTPVATDLGVNGNSKGFCAGGTRYSYVLGKQLADTPGSGQSAHVLVADKVPVCTGQPPQNIGGVLTTGSKELIDPNMRLAKLSLAKTGDGVYVLTIRVVYGDSDLLNDPTGPNATCKSGDAGRQFCAVSELTSTVTKRVDPTK